MGCDIHMFVEAFDQDLDPPQWKMVIHHDAAYGHRNYRVFAELAGVRDNWDTRPIVEPRGIPNDASAIVREEIDFYADHTHSWLLLSEVTAHKWPDDPNCGVFLDWVQNNLLSDLARLRWERPEHVRLVFGFDN
jgi:hypothetical protein